VSIQKFSGIDHLSAAISSGGCVIVGFFVWLMLPSAATPYVLAIVAVATLAFATSRYELRISVDGIECLFLCGWVVPVKRLRYLLDASIDVYESLEATKPEGVYVQPVRSWMDEEDSPCFGPSFSEAAMETLRKRANEAIQRARESLPPTPLELRCALLEKDAAKLDVRGAKRDWQNRIREVKVLDEVTIDELRLPSGTVLQFNGADYLDPRRHDLLMAAVTKKPLRLPIGIELPADTWISLTPSGKISALHGSLGLVRIDGFPIDGNATIGLEADGHVHFFTLGADLELGGWALAAGTTFSTFPKMFDRGPTWYCTLSEGLRLPQLELRPRDSVLFDKASQKLVQIYPSGEHVVDGARLSSGPVPVHPDGRIDKRRARKSGAFRRR
jgi:hypothetical protein